MPSAEACQVAPAPRSRHRLEHPVRRDFAACCLDVAIDEASRRRRWGPAGSAAWSRSARSAANLVLSCNPSATPGLSAILWLLV